MSLSNFIFLPIIFFLNSCFHQDEASELFADYQQRLTNITQSKSMPLEPSIYLSLPVKRKLILPLKEIRMDLFDAYTLKRCRLFHLIADRNSILGKVQDEFRLYEYELKFLKRMRSCFEHITEQDLSKELLHIYQKKKEQIQIVYWNAFVSSEAWRKQLTPPSNAFIGLDSHIDFDKLNQAISVFTRADENMIKTQETIEKQRLLGSLFYSIDETTRWLNTITSQLYRDEHRIQCGKNINETRLKYYLNIFQSFYIDKIQPYLSQLNSLYFSVEASLNQLEKTLPQVNSFNEYRNAYLKHGHFEKYKSAVKSHTQYWQSLFKRCNIDIQSNFR